MQPLLDGPRAGLTEQQVKNLLQSHSTLRITYGAIGYDADFGEVADLSNFITLGSSIKSSVTAAVHRTCNLNIDADVISTGWSYLSGFIKPYMVLTDVATGVSAQFNLGVYTLTTPAQSLGTSPAILQLQGYDLNYLLKQEIGDSYEVPAGYDPAQAVADVIGLAIPGVNVVVTPSGSTLTTQLTFPFDPTGATTYLSVIKTLVGTIGYREPWVDWDGKFHVEPWVDLQTQPNEWTFNTSDDDNLLADGRTQNIDVYDVPNWFRFVISNLTESPVEGQTQFTWQDQSPANPGSTVNRKRLIRHIESVPATSYGDLVNYGQSVIAAMLKPSETFTVTSQPFPLVWHLDLIHYIDAPLAASLPANGAGERKVLVTDWTLPLDGMSDMSWTWQTVTDQDAALGLASTTTG